MQVHLHTASAVLGMLLLACQIALQFAVPNPKAELLKFWLSPRCPSNGHRGGDCPVPLVVLQRNLSYSSINETALRAAGIAVPVLTSSGGEDGCPQVPGATPVLGSGAAWMCGCWQWWVCWAFPLLAGTSHPRVLCLAAQGGSFRWKSLKVFLTLLLSYLLELVY